jgi:hypothetical protein
LFTFIISLSLSSLYFSLSASSSPSPILCIADNTVQRSDRVVSRISLRRLPKRQVLAEHGYTSEQWRMGFEQRGHTDLDPRFDRTQ